MNSKIESYEMEFQEFFPSKDDILENKMCIVGSPIACSLPCIDCKWALFKCPCGCREVIELKLFGDISPKWNIESGPTLIPSVRIIVGCFSHFFITEGEVIWCDDSGKNPK